MRREERRGEELGDKYEGYRHKWVDPPNCQPERGGGGVANYMYGLCPCSSGINFNLNAKAR